MKERKLLIPETVIRRFNQQEKNESFLEDFSQSVGEMKERKLLISETVIRRLNQQEKNESFLEEFQDEVEKIAELMRLKTLGEIEECMNLGSQGEFHDQGDAKWIVIRMSLWGRNDTPCVRPALGRHIGRPGSGCRKGGLHHAQNSVNDILLFQRLTEFNFKKFQDSIL
jgi:hypothetical protein